MSCPHPAWKRDFEAVDNGRCPLCLSERVDALEAALTTAQAERDAAIALLREVEWIVLGYGYSGICPRCSRLKVNGHAADCRLAALIGGTNG